MIAGDALRTGYVSEGLGSSPLAQRWFRTPNSSVTTGLIAGGGHVVFGAQGGIVRTLDWAKGTQGGPPAWETQLDAEISGAPAIYITSTTSLIFVTTNGQAIYALHLDNGASAWQTGVNLQGTWYGGITVGDDGTVYVATDTGLVHAINPLTGDIAWTATISDSFVTASTVIGDLILVAGNDQTIYAIDRTACDTSAKTCQWARFTETDGRPTISPSILLADGVALIVVGTDQGAVQAFSFEGGPPVWSGQTSAGAPIAGLANDGARVYATASDGNVYAWDARSSGESAAIWTKNAGDALSTAPLTDGIYVLVATQAGEVRYYDAATGQEDTNRKLVFESPISFEPAPAGTWLFVPAGKLYGYGP
jgi:outer membrane protein assembly factor BamB